MPAEKRRKQLEDSSSGTDGLKLSEEEQLLARRTTIFGVVVVVLAGVALWFVATTLSGAERVSLSADVRYTVKVLEVPQGRRREAAAMLDHPVLRSLAQEHEVHLRQLPGGGFALCAGAFHDESSEEARALLKRVREYERDGKPAFSEAVMLAYTPDASE